MTDLLEPGRHVHVVGCAGAGMSALARVLVGRGLVVSGCDARASAALTQLAREGVAASAGHSCTHLDGVDVVVPSAAVADSHLELVGARRRGVAILRRVGVLAEASRWAPVVAFAGTHGKTTSTSMAAHVYRAAGLRPSWLVGEAIRDLGANGHWEASTRLLLEADESYGAFGELAPHALAITNVTKDHLDFYGDLAGVRRAFVALVARTSGPVVGNIDDDGVAAVAEASAREIIGVSRRDGAYRIVHESHEGAGSSFTLLAPEGSLEVRLRVPGAHNVTNAAVVAAVALRDGVGVDAVHDGLARFAGAPRRFEVVGVLNGAVVVDDYAHLPDEVAATVAAARAVGYHHVVAVFQPHRVSRTKALAAEFADAFDGVDHLVVTDIYRAGEANPDALTGEVVARAVATSPRGPNVVYRATLDDALEALRDASRGADCVLVLGAGDVGSLARRLVAGERP
jgi:UDP-N-acetylmuramate--alanine ligase